MNTNTNTNTNEVKNICEAINALSPRASLDRKQYATYYNGLKDLLSVVYSVYVNREKGTATAESESEAMAKVTAFLHTLGKANGKFISVVEATKTEGKASVLFDTLVYHSYSHRIFTASVTLANLEAEKITASRKKREAHTALIEGKGSAKAYKEAVKAYAEAVAKVDEERTKAGAEKEAKTKESEARFFKFVTAELKAIIQKRFALSLEEVEAQRKARNKATKEARKKATEEAKKEKEGKQ